MSKIKRVVDQSAALWDLDAGYAMQQMQLCANAVHALSENNARCSTVQRAFFQTGQHLHTAAERFIEEHPGCDERQN